MDKSEELNGAVTIYTSMPISGDPNRDDAGGDVDIIIRDEDGKMVAAARMSLAAFGLVTLGHRAEVPAKVWS